MEFDFDELLDAYSQARYDFNPDILSKNEVNQIKRLSREKRSDYGIAPIKEAIFEFITSQEKDIYFETQDFDNDDLDGMIVVPPKSRNITLIILNSKHTLLNQIN